MTYYAVLGIPQDADDETIRAAYRVLARRYHPDRGAGSLAEKFREVTQAYETLIDPGSRQVYDVSLHARHPESLRPESIVPQTGPFPQEDASVFGRFGGGPPASGAFRSRDRIGAFDEWIESLDDLFGPWWPW